MVRDPVRGPKKLYYLCHCCQGNTLNVRPPSTFDIYLLIFVLSIVTLHNVLSSPLSLLPTSLWIKLVLPPYRRNHITEWCRWDLPLLLCTSLSRGTSVRTPSLLVHTSTTPSSRHLKFLDLPVTSTCGHWTPLSNTLLQSDLPSPDWDITECKVHIVSPRRLFVWVVLNMYVQHTFPYCIRVYKHICNR